MTQPPPFAAHHRKSDGEWQTLASHLLGVAGWTKAFAGKLRLGNLGELLGLLHDLGKYSEAFQTYLKSAVGAFNPDEDEEWVDAAGLKGKIDHSTAGAQWIWRELSAGGARARLFGQAAALCIASHHSGLIDCIAGDERHFGENGFLRRMSKADERSHLDEAVKAADSAILDRCRELIRDPALTDELAALTACIGRDSAALPTHQVRMQQVGLLVRFLFSCLIDADRIDTADFERPRGARYRPAGTFTPWSALIDRLEKHLAAMPERRPIDGLRRQISEHCWSAAERDRGTYTLTVPTGGGKTLASLRFALHHAHRRTLDRIVYVIPFTSIIDQNAQVVRTILEPPGDTSIAARVVLEHHGNLTPELQTWREKMLCENWDAPLVYTTMVQFLEALFGAGTRGARRMHQLANAVLVFDEVQTLPIRCTHLFNNAVNFLATHCNSTVLLCTATQPLLHLVNPTLGAIRLADSHELMPNVGQLFEQLKRVDVRDSRRPGGWSHGDISTLPLEELQRTGSCLVIVNTKKSAQRLYSLAAAELDDEAIGHLSTDMCAAHRKHELDRVRQRLHDGLPTLCVSTQLIEAGVDIDFHVVIRFLAGLDSIAQAAGRCNRNANAERGVLHIVNLEDELLSALPDIAKGREIAQRVLDDYRRDPAKYADNLLGPQALGEYYTNYFFARKEEMSYSLTAKDIGRDDTLIEMLATNDRAVHEHNSRCNQAAPGFPLRQAFMTAAKAFRAIDAPTQGIVVPYGDAGNELICDLCSAFDVEKEFELLRRAQQYTVNVFPNTLRKLNEAGALHEVKPDTRIFCLDRCYYSARFGVSAEPVNSMEASVV